MTLPPPTRILPAEAFTEDLRSDVHGLLAELVASGAALGWVEPPGQPEVAALLANLAEGSLHGDAAVAVAWGESLAGVGWWVRYERPTHRPHADLTHLAVAPGWQRCGVGGLLLDTLIAAARDASIEQLTLDARGDNTPAHELWRSRGFSQYGMLRDFVAVADRRYDKTFWVKDLR